MKINYTWKKGFFSSLYQIFYDGEPVGNLEDNTFSKSAKGSINGKEYIFKTQGFLKQHTEIIDCSDYSVIGSIEYNNWMTKAEISINNKKINWKYDNIWNTQWSLSDSEGIMMTFKCSSTDKGQIISNPDAGLLILAGLFVTNFYLQMTFVVLIPLFIAILI